jgi:hypothetical protein
LTSGFVLRFRKKEFAFSLSLRRNSYRLPANVLDPDLVTTFTIPPPLRGHSAA